MSTDSSAIQPWSPKTRLTFPDPGPLIRRCKLPSRTDCNSDEDVATPITCPVYRARYVNPVAVAISDRSTDAMSAIKVPVSTLEKPLSRKTCSALVCLVIFRRSAKPTHRPLGITQTHSSQLGVLSLRKASIKKAETGMAAVTTKSQ